MAMDSELNAAALERLSALIDGEFDGADAAVQVCGAWRESAEMRATWHAYHLIGDVLRSDDLACDARADTAFLAAFRARMADEPVVLAPQAVPLSPAAPVRQVANGGWARTWRLPSALAAGVVAVVGFTSLPRAPDDQDRIASLAMPAPAPAPGFAAADVAMPAVASGQLIRDARLDRYLAAHKQFGGSTALGIPSGFLRDATATEADR